MNTDFLPAWPFAVSYPLLFGVLLLGGLLGGEGARLLRLPRILGYVAVGFAIAPVARALNLDPLLDQARIFVDLALGLVLFDLGRRMDLQWMKRDWTLAAAGLAESLLAFLAVFACLIALDFAAVKAGIIAAISMATSPAVVLLVVQDTRAEGQVTERSLNLVALNSLLASILTTIMLTSAHLESRMDPETAILHPAYLFVGSLFLGWLAASTARVCARAVGKTKELHFTLIAAMVVGAVGIAALLKLSVILSLLAFGLFTRNDARNYDLLTVKLAPASRLLYIVLFVITGASLPPQSLLAGGAVGLVLALARFAGKFAGVVGFGLLGGLRMRQATGLAATLMPMSTLALMLYQAVARQYPEFAIDIGDAFLATILIMEVLGPLAVQWGLRMAGETEPEALATGRHPARPDLASEA
jgi:Kef-type K+ transport system membrane component KefB